jgi:predicted DNA binding CopG/RHH family protein
MSKEPYVGKYLDDEERELIEAFEADDYVPGPSQLTPERLEFFRQAARNTLNEGTEKVSIRIARSDLARAKAQALHEGIPYQTYLKSLIHKSLRQSRAS